MNLVLQKVAYSQSYQVAEMSVDMAEDAEGLEDAWFNVLAFFANHNVSKEIMNHLRNQLIQAEIQLDPNAAIETANKRLVLEAKWREQAAESRRKNAAK